MERNSEKRRRAKYSDGQSISPIVKYRDDGEQTRIIDNCWKYRQGNEISPGNDRNERRQSNPAVDHNKNYYCPAVVPRTSRKHGTSSLARMKYVVPAIHEEYRGNDMKNQGTVRLSRNQLLRNYINSTNYGNNIAVVRKNRYNENFDEADDLENSTFRTNDNVADETSEEVVDEQRHEDAAEFNDKDYEEHEADDEIDEESDALLERQVDNRMRKIRIESLPRGQKNSSPPVPPRHHRGAKINTGKTSERFCHVAADRKTGEIPTDEDDNEEPEVRESASYSPRKLTRRSRNGEEVARIPGRNLTERYSDLTERSLTAESRQARRTRTTRPEMEKLMRSSMQHELARNIKCDHCGGTSGRTPKTTSSRNATCRLQDSRYFIGEPIGDEIYEGTSSMICQTKPRRSKESRSPIYETNDDKERTIDEDEIGAIYKSCRGKNCRETTNLRRTSARANDRHEEKFISKSNKRY